MKKKNDGWVLISALENKSGREIVKSGKWHVCDSDETAAPKETFE